MSSVSAFQKIVPNFFHCLCFSKSSALPWLQVRMQLGMAWPEEIGQTVASTWYLKWQSEAEMNFKSRKTDDFKWFVWFLIRSAIYGYILYHAFRFLRRKVPGVLGYGPIRKDPNMRKLRRVVLFPSLFNIAFLLYSIFFLL